MIMQEEITAKILFANTYFSDIWNCIKCPFEKYAHFDRHILISFEFFSLWAMAHFVFFAKINNCMKLNKDGCVNNIKKWLYLWKDNIAF